MSDTCPVCGMDYLFKRTIENGEEISLRHDYASCEVTERETAGTLGAFRWMSIRTLYVHKAERPTVVSKNH